MLGLCLVTAQRVAAAVGLPEHVVASALARGDIAGVHVGRSRYWLVDCTSLKRWPPRTDRRLL